MSQNVPADFDVKRPSKAIITDLINLANPGRTFTPDDLEITFESPLPTGQYENDADRELKVLVKATQSSYPVYVKSKDIASVASTLVLQHEGETTSPQLLAKINAELGTQLSADDIRNVEVPSTGAYPRSVSIPTNPSGLFWKGNIVVQLEGTDSGTEPPVTEPVVLTAIDATPDNLTLDIGATGTINVAAVPADASLENIAWTADVAEAVELHVQPSGGVSVKGLLANSGVVLTGKVGDVTVEVLVVINAPAESGGGE